jgi:hypothetical protein
LCACHRNLLKNNEKLPQFCQIGQALGKLNSPAAGPGRAAVVKLQQAGKAHRDGAREAVSEAQSGITWRQFRTENDRHFAGSQRAFFPSFCRFFVNF